MRYRTPHGRQRTYTIGKNGSPWTPETARTEALRLLGEIVTGIDPSAEKLARRDSMTIAKLCDRYLEDAEAGRLLTRSRVAKAASTLATDRGRIDTHIKPLIGCHAVAALTRYDVEQLMHAIADGRTQKRAQAEVFAT